jgi:hypothetical protein
MTAKVNSLNAQERNAESFALPWRYLDSLTSGNICYHISARDGVGVGVGWEWVGSCWWDVHISAKPFKSMLRLVHGTNMKATINSVEEVHILLVSVVWMPLTSCFERS